MKTHAGISPHPVITIILSFPTEISERSRFSFSLKIELHTSRLMKTIFTGDREKSRQRKRALLPSTGHRRWIKIEKRNLRSNDHGDRGQANRKEKKKRERKKGEKECARAKGEKGLEKGERTKRATADNSIKFRTFTAGCIAQGA